MIQVVRNFILAFLEESLLNAVRGPFIVVALTPIIASTGAWQYFSSSWTAFDVQRAASWSPDTPRGPTVAVVVIDEAGYQNYFEARSPLDRNKTEAFLSTVDLHSKSAKRITLDLDLSPVPGQAQGQEKLDQMFLRNPHRWVLAAVNSGTEADIEALRKWRTQLCSQGLSFGLPYIPNEFGYPKLTHQYHDGLADMSLQPPGTCADPASERVQKPMPLSPATLNAPLMIPFNGDLDALGQILDMVDPEWIFVGGAWGQYDIFGSPFGDRFGVVVHLAALDGALSHEREASPLVTILVSFFFVSLCTIVLKYMNLILDKLFQPPTPLMVGHSFYLERLQPLQFVFVVFLLLTLMSECLSLLRARTGYWIPMSFVGGATLGSLLLSWNWGQNKAPDHKSAHHMWHENVLRPIRLDLQSVASAFSVNWNGPSHAAWGVASTEPPIGRVRATMEGLFALISLIMQTVLPIILIIYTIADALKS